MSFTPSLLHMKVSEENKALRMNMIEHVAVPKKEPFLRKLMTRTLTEINDADIPSGVTHLNDYLFQNNVNLTTVNLSVIRSIGSYTFHNCGITSLDMPNLETVGMNAFSTNPFEEVCLPALESVNEMTFVACHNLKKLDFTALTQIKSRAFYNCENLDTIIFRGNTMVPFSGSSPFTGTKFADGTGYFYVKADMLNEYQNDSGWQLYENQFRTIEDYSL